MESLRMVVGGRIALPGLTVWIARLIWLAILGGQVALAVVFGVIASQGGGPRLPRGVERPALALDAAMLLAAVVVTVVVRRRALRGGAGEVPVGPRYVRAMLVPMAALEAPGLLGIFLAFATGQLYPYAIVPALAVVIQLTLFPKAAMRA